MFDKVTEIFNINCEAEFEEMALKVFRFQYEHNVVYKHWVSSLVPSIEEVKTVKQIPFLPIELFKTHPIVSYSGDTCHEIFTSSSTTGQIPSKHYVKDISLYKTSFLKCFQKFFGKPSDHCILALLPGYMDRQGSSLVYMCKELIELSQHNQSGFYLRNMNELVDVIKELKAKKQKTILIGVSYALLDLAEMNIQLNEYFTVIETGGMKGNRREMLKEELHDVLKNKFKIKKIASEYGMTELLSQAYALEDGLFSYPNWMRFLIRDINDPLSYLGKNKTGGINVIDLANVYSCSFIATQDLGQLNDEGKLKLMGRYDSSDVRGCNLMVQ